MDRWLGYCLFTIAVLPIFGGGTIQLFSAEAIGVTHDKTHPRIDVMAKWLWMIYAILTIAETVLLMIGGMSFLMRYVIHSQQRLQVVILPNKLV